MNVLSAAELDLREAPLAPMRGESGPEPPAGKTAVPAPEAEPEADDAVADRIDTRLCDMELRLQETLRNSLKARPTLSRQLSTGVNSLANAPGWAHRSTSTC